MKLDPRYRIVAEAELEIKQGIANTLAVLDLPWVDILYHVAMIKAGLLAEMGATVRPHIKVEDIPDEQHVIGSAFYMPLIKHELTNTELYRIICDWELAEAYGMIKANRKDKP